MKAHVMAPIQVIIRGWGSDRILLEPTPGLILEVERKKVNLAFPLKIGEMGVLEDVSRTGKVGRPAHRYTIHSR